MQINKFINKTILPNFIVFEGLDGCGKTTQLDLLAGKIIKHYNSIYNSITSMFINPLTEERVYKTAEPTNKATGKFLRRVLKGEFILDARTVAFLFSADRCEHLYGEEGIVSKTAANKYILCDRYLFSSLAYQTVTCEEELPFILNYSFPLPEVLVYIKVEPKLALKRIYARAEENDKEEAPEIYERLELQEKIYRQYEEIFSAYSGYFSNNFGKFYRKEEKGARESLEERGARMHIITLDGSRSAGEIADTLWQELKKLEVIKN